MGISYRKQTIISHIVEKKTTKYLTLQAILALMIHSICSEL